MIDVINFYKVESLEKVKDFYEKILGFKLYKDQGKCLIYDVHYGKLGFCVHFPEASSESCLTFVYKTKKEVDEKYKLLLKSSVEIKHPPKTNEGFKIYHFFVKDFNGLTLEFQSFIEEDQ